VRSGSRRLDEHAGYFPSDALAEFANGGRPLLAHMLLAAIDEATLYIANADHRRQARNQSRRALNQLLNGLRTDN